MPYQGDMITISYAVVLDLASGPVFLSKGGSFLFDPGNGYGEQVFSSDGGGTCSIVTMDVPGSEIGSEAPVFQMVVAPASDTKRSEIANAANQLRTVSCHKVEINRTTGVVIHSSKLFDGVYDMSTLRDGRDGLHVDILCVDDLEIIFEHHRGNRLSNAFHTFLWPGETGLNGATGVERRVAWGVKR